MIRQKTLAEIREAFRQALHRQGMRCTPERIAILDCAVSCAQSFTSEDLLHMVARSGMTLSPASIYNNLELLCRMGVLRKFRTAESSVALYERITGNTSPVRLVCTICGKIIGARSRTIVEALQQQTFASFIPEQYSITIYGTCKACRRKHNKKHNYES